MTQGMVKMITESVHDYAGHRLQPGQEFYCEAQHVDLMKKLGRARVAAAAPAAEDLEQRELLAGQQEYRTRDMTAGRPRRGRGRAK